MQANRSRDTRPEMAVRQAAHAAGLRYRVDSRPIPTFNRRADMVFTRAKVAVFIDGCFWHGCPEHHTVAKQNAAFWAEKVRRNRERDKHTDQVLVSDGWTVIRAWEHEPVAQVVERIRMTLHAGHQPENRGASHGENG